MFGLCSLITNSCCCGISLRTGTITILILNLIGGLSAFLDYRAIGRYGLPYGISYVIAVIIEISALYGTFKRKPNFMIPHLVMQAIYLISFLLTIIGLIILLPFASKALHIHTSEIGSFYLYYAVVIVILLIFEAIGFHLYKVVLSHYYELKTVLLNVNPPPIGFSA